MELFLVLYASVLDKLRVLSPSWGHLLYSACIIEGSILDLFFPSRKVNLGGQQLNLTSFSVSGFSTLHKFISSKCAEYCHCAALIFILSHCCQIVSVSFDGTLLFSIVCVWFPHLLAQLAPLVLEYTFVKHYFKNLFRMHGRTGEKAPSA